MKNVFAVAALALLFAGRMVQADIPTTPVVNDDGVYTTSLDVLHAYWSSTDPESGISEYQYAIGTTAGGLDLIGWTSAGPASQIIRSGLSLINGDTYYFDVKARNGVGLWSAVGVSDGITVDRTLPTTPVVIDDGASTTIATSLHAAWTSSDPQSGISQYDYAIGTTPGGLDITDWTSSGTASQITRFGLSLVSGTTYYFAVKARDGAGVWSAVGVSDGIMFQTAAVPEPASIIVLAGDLVALLGTRRRRA